MSVSQLDLKNRKQDYFVALWQNDELEMKPYCACGQQLDEDYYCPVCDRQCECTFVLCQNQQTLQVVQKFLSGNPDFRNFQSDLLGD